MVPDYAAVNESQTREKNESIVEASNQIASQKAEINALEKELESYRTKNDEAQTAKENGGVHKKQLRSLMDIQTQYQSGAKSMKTWRMSFWQSIWIPLESLEKSSIRHLPTVSTHRRVADYTTGEALILTWKTMKRRLKIC